MKVYVYDKKTHKRYDVFVNVKQVLVESGYFYITTHEGIEEIFNCKDFMFSVYGY